MADKVEILTSDIEHHDAILASRLAFPTARVPDRIEVLNKKWNRVVYRLPGIGPQGKAVIAKACASPESDTEHYVYTEVLSRTELSSAELYAFVDEGPGGWSWLFLEDVGRTRYRSTDPRHREKAARWLATFHVEAADLVHAVLPAVGAAEHLPHVTSLTARLSAASSMAHGNTRLLRLVEQAIRLCEPIEDRWDEVEELCGLAPQTIVHGDCVAKNVQAREERNGLTIIPIDWATSGWGTAATCLGQLDLPKHPGVSGERQYAAYFDVVRPYWPEFDVKRIEQLAVIGRLFWAVQAVGWGLDAFGWKPVDEALADLKIYVHILDGTLRSADWYK